MPFDAAKFVEGYAALMTTVASWPDVVTTENGAGPPLPFVVQPATKRMAIRDEIARARDTRPRLNREMLNIAAILFGLTGLQEWRIEAKLNPGPHNRNLMPQ